MITQFPENNYDPNTQFLRNDGKIIPIAMPSDYVKVDQTRLLGSYANSTAKRNHDELEDATSKRFFLQNLAHKLCPTHRIRNCLKGIVTGASNVPVTQNKKRGTAGFGNLQTCGSVWACPVCASKITEQRLKDIQEAIRKWDGDVVMVTFTMSHSKHESYEDIDDRFRNARSWFKGHRTFKNTRPLYGWEHSITAYETTDGDNGWHVHCHDLAFVDKLGKGQHKFLQSALKPLWSKAIAKFGGFASEEHGLQVEVGRYTIAEYLAKFGKMPEDLDRRENGKWGLAHEMAKSNVKIAKKNGRTPWQLLVDYGNGDKRAGLRFKEYVEATSGRRKRQIVWSKGLRKLLNIGEELTDKELAELEDEASETVVIINLRQWRTIVKNNWRGYVLKLVRADQIPQLKAFLHRLE